MHSSCGKYLVDGSWAGQLTVRSATSGKVAFQTEFSGATITKIASSSDGNRWFVLHQPTVVSRDAAPEPAIISIWAWPLTAPIEFVTFSEHAINAFAVSPDNRHICIVGNDAMSVMALAEKRVIRSVPYLALASWESGMLIDRESHTSDYSSRCKVP